MSRLLIAILLTCVCAAADAQKRLLTKADSLVSAFYFNSGFDTAYVSRPVQRFMAAFHPDFSSIGIMIGKRVFIGADYVLYATLLGDSKRVATRLTRNITRFFFGFWF